MRALLLSSRTGQLTLSDQDSCLEERAESRVRVLSTHFQGFEFRVAMKHPGCRRDLIAGLCRAEAV